MNAYTHSLSLRKGFYKLYKRLNVNVNHDCIYSKPSKCTNQVSFICSFEHAGSPTRVASLQIHHWWIDVVGLLLITCVRPRAVIGGWRDPRGVIHVGRLLLLLNAPEVLWTRGYTLSFLMKHAPLCVYGCVCVCDPLGSCVCALRRYLYNAVGSHVRTRQPMRARERAHSRPRVCGFISHHCRRCKQLIKHINALR